MISLKHAQTLLKQSVLGQDEGINQLTQAVYKYLIRLYARDFGQEFSGSTSILIQGDSGSGKTHLVEKTAKLFDIPMIIINAKSICQEGWHGKSFIELCAAEMNSLGYPAGGIIFIDEIDKLLVKNVSSTGEDVNQLLQQGILKYIEGHKTIYKGVRVDFSRWMFVFAGAFVGIENQDKQPQEIGFISEKPADVKFNLTMQQVIKYGMIPEFAGRIQNLVKLNRITADIYTSILEAKDGQHVAYTEMFHRMGLDFQLDKEKAIRHAVETNLGVRGLIQAIEIQVSDFMDKNVNLIDVDVYSPLHTNATSDKPTSNVYTYRRSYND